MTETTSRPAVAPPDGRRVRVLYLTHRVPYPPDKGDRIRNFHLLRQLSRRAEVWLGCLADEPVSPEAAAELDRLCGRVAVVPASGKRRWLRAGMSLLNGRSLSEGAFAEPGLAKVVRGWTAETTFDAVVVSASSLVPYLRRNGLETTPAVVDLVDVDSQKWLDFAAAKRGPKRWLYRLEASRVRKLERSLPAWVRAVGLVSRAEADVYDTIAGAGTATAALNGVDLEYFDPTRLGASPLPQRFVGGEVGGAATPGEGEEASPGVQPQPPHPDTKRVRPLPQRSVGGEVNSQDPSLVLSAAFVGALDYLPNVDAAVWFAREVWPLIRAKYPAAEFHLIGRKPTPEVQVLAALPGVKLIGQVPDVRPFLAAATVAVVPLRLARGLQNKVLEALAMGKAVVAAPAALAALKTQPGIDLLAATTPAEWVDAVGGLFEDPARVRELGAAGRLFVEEHHHWEHCLQPLIDKIVNPPAATP